MAVFRLRFGELEAGVLEVEHTLAEGLALLHVGERVLEHDLHGGHGADRDDQALLGQLLHELHETHAGHGTQQARLGKSHTLEEQLRGVLTVEAHLLEVATTTKALAAIVSTTISDTPAPFCVGSVLAATITRFACCPFVMNVFWPSSR